MEVQEFVLSDSIRNPVLDTDEFRKLQKNIVLFFSPKGQLLYSIAAQTLAYRFVLHLHGTAKIQWLLI